MPPRRDSERYKQWKGSAQYQAWIAGRSGQNNPMSGRQHSEDTKSLISAIRIRHFQEIPAMRQNQSNAQRESYQRDPTRKDRQRETIVNTYNQNPYLRQNMRDLKLQQYANDPSLAERVRAGHLGQLPRPGTGHCKRHDYERADGRRVSVQGTFELAVCLYLDEREESWDYVGSSKAHAFPLDDGSYYYPDFYLYRLRLYIDPKGCEMWGAKARRAQQEYPGRIVVLLGKTYLAQLALLLDHLSGTN